jgi:general secretion pathway protein K
MRRPTRRRQRGAALLLAMVIVTLVATLTASMVYQQWRAVQVEEAERVRSQAAWVLMGALDWARLILREDGRGSSYDHLGEVWATPLAETSVASFLASDDNGSTNVDSDLPDAFLSGKVDDATARYNLRRLIGPDGEIDPGELAVFQKLCEFAGLAPSLADGVAQSMRLALLAQQADNPDMLAKLGGEQGRARAPLMPQSVDQLLWLGLDAATLERLRPFVVVLPDVTPTINVNTAPPEVIAAAVDGLDLGRASRLIQVRQRNPFKTIDDVRQILGDRGALGAWDLSRLSTISEYFQVLGRLRYEDYVLVERHLVQRITGSNDVVVRQQSRFAGMDAGLPTGQPPR